MTHPQTLLRLVSQNRENSSLLALVLSFNKHFLSIYHVLGAALGAVFIFIQFAF